MKPTPEHPQQPEELPKARIEKNWKSHLIWLVPLAAAGFAGWLVYRNLFATGPNIHIFFANTQGLQPDNAQLKYRGTKVGTVKSMQLSQDKQNVDVEVSLDKSAADLAREGTQFWIVKPEVSLGQIQGLQTIVSGAYIEAKPGGGKQRDHFQGLPEAPVVGQEKKGLSLVLVSDKLGSVQKGAPIYYREVKVGVVLGFEFNERMHALQIPVWINEPYVSLIGRNTRFWDAGGLQVQMNLGGIQVSTESVKALVAGGVAFATPGGPQGKVEPGTTFQLHPKPLPEWLGYAPTNQVGTRITIRFADAHGLMSGQSDVRFRDAKIGQVLEVALNPDARSVKVIAELGMEGAQFAREGSQFWIMRPEISAGSIRGMQTIGTGDYIGVKPGHGKPQFEFEGMAEPPLIQLDEPGLNVVLLADKAGSLQQGSPVYYRGIKVGQVLGSKLGPESQAVQITARIDEHYVPLVRKNSVFWNAGGINMDLGLLGVDVRAQSLKALISGGVDFATPDNPGPPAMPDIAFRLYDKPQNQWLSWAPTIKLEGN